MSPAYPLRLFFDCSTAHLSTASRDYLDAHAIACDGMISSTPYGWFVWCGDEIEEDVPADLAAIILHARALDADYILFDADAEMSDALPRFEWPDWPSVVHPPTSLDARPSRRASSFSGA